MHSCHSEYCIARHRWLRSFWLCSVCWRFISRYWIFNGFPFIGTLDQREQERSPIISGNQVRHCVFPFKVHTIPDSYLSTVRAIIHQRLHHSPKTHNWSDRLDWGGFRSGEGEILGISFIGSDGRQWQIKQSSPWPLSELSVEKLHSALVITSVSALGYCGDKWVPWTVFVAVFRMQSSVDTSEVDVNTVRVCVSALLCRTVIACLP